MLRRLFCSWPGLEYLDLKRDRTTGKNFWRNLTFAEAPYHLYVTCTATLQTLQARMCSASQSIGERSLWQTIP